MADFTRSIELIFGGRDNVSNTIKLITRNLDEFENSVGRLSAPLAATTDAILKVDAVLASLGVALVAFSVGEAIKFESSQLDLQKVLNDTEGDVNQYKDAISELALTYGVFASDVTAATADFKQAGFTISESLQLVEQSLIATKISELSADESSRLLVATLKGFGLEASASADILDTWNETSNRFATNTREIATGLSELGPIAKLAGLDLDQTTSLLLPIIEVFGSGTEAANALKTGLLKLVDDTTSVTGALEELQISQTKANGELKTAGEIIFEVIGRFTELSEAQQLQLAGQLVGINQAGRLATVLSDENKILDVQAALLDKAGSATEELAIRMQATEEAINRLKTAFSEVQRVIGDEFLAGTKQSTDALTNLLISFKQVVESGGLAPLFDVLNPLLTDFSVTVNQIAKNLPEAFSLIDFTGLSASLEDLGSSIAGLFDGVNLSTPEGLASALQKLIDSGESLIRISSNIIASFKPLFDTLASGVDSFNDLDDTTKSFVGSVLGVGKQIDLLLPLFSSAIGLVGALASVLQIKLLIQLTGATAGLGSLSGALSSTAALMGQAGLLGAAAGLGLGIGKLITIIDELTGSHLTTFIGDVAASLTGLDEKFDNPNLEQYRSDLDKLRDQFGITGNAADRFSTSQDKVADSISMTKQPVALTVDEIDKMEQSQLAAEASSQRLADQMLKMGLATDGTAKSITGFTGTAIHAGEASNDIISSFVDGVPSFTQAGEGIRNVYKNTAESADEAKEKSDEFLIKMEEIASNERIKTIEATVEFNIAKLESDTKTILAAFESVDNAINSTGDLIGSLFGLLTETTGTEALAIERQLRREEDRREAEFELQQKLVESQIGLIQERTNSLARGDSLITIQADGLEPELEAFMWEILKRIQVKAAEEQALYLLGLPQAA